MNTQIMIIIVLAYGAIHLFEVTALFARVAGIKHGSVLVGYSVQNAVYMITRFFLIALLPMLGLLVDLGASKYEYQVMAHMSLLAAATSGIVVINLSPVVLAYYTAVIEKYTKGKGFLSSFFTKPNRSIAVPVFKLRNLIKNRAAAVLLGQASMVYLVYSTGIFVSFFFALIYSEYSTSISQMSGAINAFGAVLLTMFVEPKISRSIDGQGEDAIAMVFCLIWARVIATGVTGQILLLVIFASF